MALIQPLGKMKNVVFGEGPPDARIMLVGQNPEGKRPGKEDLSSGNQASS